MKLILFSLSLFLGSSLFSQTMVQKTVHPCGTSGDVDYYHPKQLRNKRLEGDTLYLNLGLVRNCSFYPQIDLSFQADSFILNVTNTSDLFNTCECYYEIELKIIGIADTNFTVYFNYEYSDSSFAKVSETHELKQYSSKYIFPTPAELQIITTPDELSSTGQKIGYWRITNEKKSLLALYELNESGVSFAA